MESQDERSAFARPSSPESPVTPPPQRVVRKGSRPGEFRAGFGGNSDHETNGITNTDTEEEKNQNPEEYVKVTVAKKAEKLIVELLAKVNDGFEGGRVNRQDLISWILARFANDCTDQDIKAIRADHFDEITLLELSLKKYKQVGSLPPELKKLLMTQAGLDDLGRKSHKKSVDNKVNQ